MFKNLRHWWRELATRSNVLPLATFVTEVSDKLKDRPILPPAAVRPMPFSATGYHLSPRHIEQISNIEKCSFLGKIRSTKRGEGKKHRNRSIACVPRHIGSAGGGNGLAWLSPINAVDFNPCFLGAPRLDVNIFGNAHQVSEVQSENEIVPRCPESQPTALPITNTRLNIQNLSRAHDLGTYEGAAVQDAGRSKERTYPEL